MAEAAVEERPPALRFYCHLCNVQFANASAVSSVNCSICLLLAYITFVHIAFNLLLQNFTCPHCSKGFIEELETNLENAGVGAFHDLHSDDEASVS